VAIIPVTFCEAMGKPEINNSFAVASALIHIPLVLLLVPRFGITGAAIALFLNSATQTLIFIVYASRTLFHVSLGELLRTTLVRPLAAAAMTAALAYLVARPLIQNRLTLILALAFLPIVYLGVAFLFSAITRDDLAGISQVLPRPRAGQ